MNCLNFLTVCVIVAAANELCAATNLVSGVIATDTTLSGTNLVQGTVVVTNDVVLTIEPGARMLMSANATLLVYGQLVANGASNQPILFTRAVAGQRWNRVRFNRAAPSRLAHCIFEFANSGGTHLDYYPTNCSTGLGPSPRSYHEAIVALATHLDVEGCTFRNLPDVGGEGDALAIISDDPNLPGTATARIWKCQFLDIGQGIHSRYSHILVENCFFNSHNGDNDDIDMYGESTPPPLIRNNVFLNAHDDFINPTRCSAIIMNNVFAGTSDTDHGLVLRDQGSPVVINNVIYNCANGGISVQNDCDALIANNTIVNCGRGIRLFDHFDRHGPRYCLTPGSGRATVINCVVWDSSINSFTLTDSTNPFPNSVVRVYNCNVEGGQGSASVAPNSTLLWGAGNINMDPQFVGLSTNNYHLRSNSPCIDAATNVAAIATNAVASITDDLDHLPRPLDGNGDGAARFDIGAYEFLLATADSNSDGIPDGWTWRYGLNPADPSIGAGNPDGDPHTTLQEWYADTDPTNAVSWFQITPCFDCGITPTQEIAISFLSSTGRVYTLLSASNLVNDAAAWAPVTRQFQVPGNGATRILTDSAALPRTFYRVLVEVP